MKADKKCANQEIVDIKGFPLAANNVNGVKNISCKNIPQQTNGTDCGVFVIKYFEMVMNATPSSTLEDIDNRFGFNQHAFSVPEAITEERENLKIKINELSLEWNELVTQRNTKVESEYFAAVVEDADSDSISMNVEVESSESSGEQN